MKTNKMIKCLVLGGEGMLGHILVKYIKTLKDFEVVFTTRDSLDVYKNQELIEDFIKKVKPHLVINCIGIINKFVTEENKEEVEFVNSVLPHKLADICKANDSKLIHISTDCVFSGEVDDSSRVEGEYTEDSKTSPTDLYGTSKASGEINDGYNLTIRTSLIGLEIKEPKTGLMEWLFEKNNSNIEIDGYLFSIWSGVTTLELAKQIIDLSARGITGLINIASKPIDKFQLLCLIKEVYNLDVIINPSKGVKCDRSMKSVRDVEYSIPGHREMLQELKEFTESKKNVN